MAILTISLNYWLIPLWGLWGAALATALTLVIINLLISSFLFVKFKMFPYHFSFFKILVPVLVTLAINYFLPILDWWWLDVIYRSIIAAFIFIGITLVLGISSDVNSLLKGLLNRK